MLTFDGSDLVITDGDGTVKFDTSEQLFTITDVVSSDVLGPVVTAQVSATGTPFGAPYQNFTTDHLITTVHPDATTIIGMFQTTVASGGGQVEAADGIWRQCTGTHVQAYRGVGTFDNGLNNNDLMSSLILYTFFLDSGDLYMRERFVMRSYASSGPNTIMIQRAVTVEFRLFVGLFI